MQGQYDQSFIRARGWSCDNCQRVSDFDSCQFILIRMGFITDRLQSWTKVLGHFCVSGEFSISHRSNPSPHPTSNVGRVYPEFFPSFNFVQGGGGITARKFRKGCTLLRGNREMTEKYEYCSTVPRTLVQDCLNPGFGGKKSVFLIFPTLFRHFGDKQVITCNNNDL